MESVQFRKVASDEIDDVHAIYHEVFYWLKDKGVRQWLMPKSRDFFENFRRKDQLYGLFLEKELAAFAALIWEKPPHWAEETDVANGAWVNRLTLNPRFRGQEIGALFVRHLIVLARRNGASHICLDAVEGTMPGYYGKLGFQKRKAGEISYPNSGTFPVVFLDIKFPDPKAAGVGLRCRI